MFYSLYMTSLVAEDMFYFVLDPQLLKGNSSMEEHLPYKQGFGSLIPPCPTIN